MASTSTSFYADFVPVNRKKRRSKVAQREKQPLSVIVQRLRDELGQDDWLSQCQQILSESFVGLAFPEEVICLGLGSPSASPNARAQLAFLLASCQYLNIEPEKVFLYDPVFTEDDCALLGALRMNVLTENKDGKYTLERPTLCFMPHCDMELYENVIKANWNRRHIPFLMLVANRLMDYIDSSPKHKLETKAPFLLAIAPTLECRPFPPSPHWPTAFNNLAVQVFGGSLRGLPEGDLDSPQTGIPIV